MGVRFQEASDSLETFFGKEAIKFVDEFEASSATRTDKLEKVGFRAYLGE